MSRFVLIASGAIAMTAAAPAAAQSEQRTIISPYIQVGQILTADLRENDVLTYSTVTAGIDASIQTRRVEVQLNYQYERRLSWDDRLQDGDVHSGLARAAVQIVPGLSVEAGGIATRSRFDSRGDAPLNLVGNVGNTVQVYSAYAGPSFARQFGPASVSAGYRFGYTRVEAPDVAAFDPTLPPIDVYDEARSHLAIGSVSTRAGSVLPFGLTISGAWQRETADQLDQRYEGLYGRADAVQPVSRTVALLAGIGYERIDITQRDALLDADGFPVVDGNGRFVTDPASPRREAFAFDGVYYDGGILWRPSPRLTLEARVGERYGTLSATGSLSWQTGAGSGLQIGVYDSVQSFGRQLNSAIDRLPRQITNTGDPFSDNYNGCIFGSGNGAGGGCLNGVFQSVTTANFRARGVDAVWSATRGGTQFGLGGGYAHRRFYVPDVPVGAVVDGTSDQAWYAQLFAARALDSQSSVTGNIYGNYYDSGIAGGGDVWGIGANAAYSRNFGRVNAQIVGGIDTFDSSNAVRSDVIAQALVALGYRF
ncbi:hypothetical protein NYR55_02940 [Sphingomonas sp. BGYR3]|uniref:hypothetical protein n=1 Tax=Sphingomonas sp. BGYR3 TaxID=2975483 RepID=UPI0021A5EDF2|nr:hypothetical protein [Sphingomonas sp. BGYR3]MDG5487580.1 hypothetical protein [Sphingomonas sp. BGYR3]